jgi:hypothetical protein
MMKFTTPTLRQMATWMCALSLHGAVTATEPTHASQNDDCPMQAPTIERKQLLSKPGVLAVSLSADERRAAVLLKDGQAIQIYHIGCQHVGFQAERWLDALPQTRAQQLQAIRQLIKTALQDPNLKDISMTRNDFNVRLDGLRILYSHTQEDLYAEFTHQNNGRYLLSVTYALAY